MRGAPADGGGRLGGLALPCVRGVDGAGAVVVVDAVGADVVVAGVGAGAAATMVDDHLVVLTHDVDSEFLCQHERRDKAEGMR